MASFWVLPLSIVVMVDASTGGVVDASLTSVCAFSGVGVCGDATVALLVLQAHVGCCV